MNNFTFKDIMLVFQKCFNYIDTRLDRHCEQVAFLYWKTLQHTGKYTEEELVNLTLIALFHDIGTWYIIIQIITKNSKSNQYN